MFSFFSWGGGKLSRKLVPVCLALCLLWAVLAGCDTGIVGGNENIPGTLPAGLISNNWTSTGGDGYEITATTIKYYYGTQGSPDFYYEGTIRSVTNFTVSSGVIIFEYTDGTYVNLANPFTATYYRDLSANSVQLADAYDQVNPPTETATLQEAITKFTVHTVGDFVEYWGSYSK